MHLFKRAIAQFEKFIGGVKPRSSAADENFRSERSERALKPLIMNLQNLDTPALIIDQDMVARNIKLAIKLAGGVARLRPHVKTHKILEVAKMQVAAGITKFKCATIAEAEMLGMAGAIDVLIAYAVQGPKVDRVISLMEKYPDTVYSVLIDNMASAKHINERFKQAGKMASVFVDVNNGHGRTGIKTEEVPALARACKELESLNINGLHCYDGHIKMPSLEKRMSAGQAAFKPVLELREQLIEIVGEDLLIVAGGSPSFSVHAKHHDVECSPGTWIFWDHGYGEAYPEQAFERAATLATRVISKVDAHHYCLDLGHKSVASESPLPRAHFHSGHGFEQVGHSEEHLMIRTEAPDVFEPGDVLLATPNHVCPTVALYDHVEVVSNGALTGRWKVIARDRKITL
jgi:D-serine deaminase-like pyridoxal phosphate-dependent protein